MAGTQTFGMSGVEVEPARTGNTRILFLIDEIGGIAEGGTERQVLQLIELATRLGYAPRLAVLRGTEWLTEEQAGCPIYFAGMNSLLRPAGWRACAKLIQWMRHERIALVQTFFGECNLFGPWMARLARVPVVVGSRRNLNQWQGYSAWIEPWMLRLQRLSNVSTDCVIANSLVVAEQTFKTERLPHGKLYVAYNGIDLARFSGLDLLRGPARRMLGIAEDEILVGNISCFRKVKGIPQFIDAARIVLQQEPRMRFLVVGDGSEYGLVAERIRRYGLGDRIHLAGQQTDVFPYLAAMDIGVLSSLAEGFSNSLLEYMASGLPAIATEVGGNREALEGAGILVAPDNPEALAEAILELRPEALRQQLALAARQRVERFSLPRAEKRMKEIYAELLQIEGGLPKEH
ncbi:MAG TPA: glycosyltransferase [Acidobacteriaceae bacterium]|nr:glycosyltransferase [Acidobacteriaceae bacterium]